MRRFLEPRGEVEAWRAASWPKKVLGVFLGVLIALGPLLLLGVVLVALLSRG